MPKIAEAFVRSLRRYGTTVLKSDSKMARAHSKEMRDLWSPHLRALRLVILLTNDIGEHVFHFVTADVHRQTRMIEVLLRLCARGTQIGRETAVLLEAGFPDGASARWRTLHEIAITAAFIAKQGEGTAERYLLFDAVDALAGARKYQDAAQRYGLDPISECDMSGMVKAVEDLKSRYGCAFTKKNGWASHVLSGRAVSFRDIEENSGVSPVRSAYALASFNVHATPRGVMTRLSHENPGELLTGPSVEGLWLPLRQTALDLGLLFEQLLSAAPTPTHRLFRHALQAFVDDVVNLPDPCETKGG